MGPATVNAQIAEVKKSPCRECRFHQCDVTVDGSPCHIGLCKVGRGVGFGAIHTQFVIGLLVASGVDGGSHLHPFGDDKNILDAFTVKPERSTQAGCSGTDDESIYMTLFHSLAISMPPPMSMTVPVE